MMHRVDNMPKRFRSIKENFEHLFRGTTSEPPRTVICGNYVNSNIWDLYKKILRCFKNLYKKILR